MEDIPSSCKPESVDETTWNYVADWGSNDQVLEFLKKANLESLDLSRIAFRMHDKAFFTQVTQYLTDRDRFVPALWAYSVRHNEVEQIEQMLQHQQGFHRAARIAIGESSVKNRC